MILGCHIGYPSLAKLLRNGANEIIWRSHSCSVGVLSTDPTDGIVDPSAWDPWMRVELGAAKSQMGEAERSAAWWDHSRPETPRMIHSLTLGMLTPQREGREWGASRSHQQCGRAWKRALLLAGSAAAAAGEITAEARAESPTKSGIRGETAETGKASKKRKMASEMHVAPRIVVHCCPFLPILAHCFAILAHCCSLLLIVAHCYPLLPIVKREIRFSIDDGNVNKYYFNHINTFS